MILLPRAWGELATGQPTGWVLQWTVNVIPPSPLITECVCPVGTHPSAWLWAKKWGALPTTPSSLTSLFSAPSQLPPGDRTTKETLSQPPSGGALGPPDSRSAIGHFLWGCAPFLGPLWPLPSYSLSPAHPSFPPHPPAGSGQSEHWETGRLTRAWLFTSASKPTTRSCSREDESSARPGAGAEQKRSEQIRSGFHLEP